MPKRKANRYRVGFGQSCKEEIKKKIQIGKINPALGHPPDTIRLVRSEGKMMSKWEMKERVIMVPVPIDATIYQEHLAQIAKILYKKFCQLDPRFKPVPIPLSRHSAPQDNREVRR